MIDGMSWESSAIYYRILNEAVKERLGGHHSAQTLMLAAPAPRAARRVVAASVEHGSQGPEAGRMIRLPTDAAWSPMTSVTSKLLTILTTGLQGPIIDSLAQGKPGEGERRDAIRRSQRGENLSVGGRRYGRGPRSREDLRGWWNDGPCLEGRGLENTTW